MNPYFAPKFSVSELTSGPREVLTVDVLNFADTGLEESVSVVSVLLADVLHVHGVLVGLERNKGTQVLVWGGV